MTFSDGSEKILVDKELKYQKQQIDKIEAEWSKAHDIVKANIAVSDAEADIPAWEQPKNSLCPNALKGESSRTMHPVSSEDVDLMFTKIQKHPEG